MYFDDLHSDSAVEAAVFHGAMSNATKEETDCLLDGLEAVAFF